MGVLSLGVELPGAEPAAVEAMLAEHMPDDARLVVVKKNADAQRVLGGVRTAVR